MEQVSSHNISEIRDVGQSSGNPTANARAPISSSSLRIQRIIKRSKFSSGVEFDIENSRDHWSEFPILTVLQLDCLIANTWNCSRSHQWGRFFKFIKVVFGQKIKEDDTDNASPGVDNSKHFEMLKKHPEWGGFFKDIKVVLGQKINEGGQAEIYDAIVESEDGHKSPGYGYHVVKVMKGDTLQEFQRQWPIGMLCNVSNHTRKGPLFWIKGGTLIDNKFAFVMVKQWGDLRRLTDLRMQLNKNRGPPFRNFEFVKQVMTCIARDMDKLHTEYEIVHRDLKASNVLLWSLGEGLPDNNPHVQANVVDYECSIGVVGTGFWRAPEIFQHNPSSRCRFFS